MFGNVGILTFLGIWKMFKSGYFLMKIMGN